MTDRTLGEDGAGGPLRALTAEEGALTARYPLPAGVPDAVVNQYQLADALDTSQTTLANWRRLGLPVEVEGTNGRSYQFRLSLCFAWMRKREADDRTARLAAEDATQQLRLALTGGTVAPGAEPGLSRRDAIETLQLEKAWTDAARARGELIAAAEVAEALQAVFAEIRDGLDAAPDRLARDLGLDGAGVEAAQMICDDILEGARRRIADLFGAGRGTGEDGAAALDLCPPNDLGPNDLDRMTSGGDRLA
ncbi:terminase small subunit [Amaricoccus solimangrovi]|uniref:terminase small subunit n=1 Tax=Amaricoccus solimangrovi TaxID=2589815 RepID=UPI0015E45FFC|nr:terminase small subunit [Amaricoccus solimangrovi]